MKMLFAAAAMVVSLTVLVWIGGWRWASHTSAIRDRLTGAEPQHRRAPFHESDLNDLPAPVQRYLRSVLVEGQPLIRSVELRQFGQFRMRQGEDSWRPFHATQLVTTNPPAFDWDAKIAMLPGVGVRVRDAYSSGRGTLVARIFGLIKVAEVRGGGLIAEGELVRYLAEAPWYPTVFLPGQGIEWGAIDDSRARATLTHGGLQASVEFEFDAAGLISAARVPDRPRDEDGAMVPTPWEGRFDDYVNWDGLRVPLHGEVEWHLPEGPFPYWKGSVLDFEYQFQPPIEPQPSVHSGSGHGALSGSSS